jgi:ABC-type Fe3+-siderophore transport system permease subunit
MSFRRMITPALIQILFVLAVVGSIIVGVVVLIAGVKHHDAHQWVIGIGLIIFGPLAVRLWAEALIVVFRINETLTDIRALAIWTAEREHNDDINADEDA